MILGRLRSSVFMKTAKNLIRLSCRLPQTPRTPSTGILHYFDDVFTRHLDPDKPQRQKMRRSSTSRSMGARSDFDTSVNGDDEPRSVGNSIGPEDLERERERREADAHTAHYVSEQLSRVRSNQSADYETGDEFEAQ